MQLKLTILSFFSFLLFIELPAQQTEKFYLSGTGNDDTKQWQFFCTAGSNANKWSTIAVPSCWELQGYGKYDYGFAKDSVRGKEKGMYKYSFHAPATWKNKVVKIVFEGSMTDTEVFINGKPAGEIHQGAFYSFKYDITTLLKFGDSNLLEVTVAKHSANASVNEAERKADFWIFGGIFRPVFLEILPQAHMENISIDAKANGRFTANIQTSLTKDQQVMIDVYDDAGKLLGKLARQVKPAAPGMITVTGSLRNPKLWTAETPMLYRAVITLSEKGKRLHTLTQKFGFRTVEVKQRDGIYVNGVKVKMKGVNRHSFWPTSGRTTSRKISIADVLLMKSMNMNAVRMSHYPPDDHFLEVSDSLGLFVMDELAGWHGHYDTPTGKQLLQEMIRHDGNHPSIILWSNGNEGGHNLQLDAFFDEFDLQKRPVVHPWQSFRGIETQHYREYNYGLGNYENGREIIMPTEFLHGQFDGGHGAGLQDYWEKMWHNPLSAGGFLWDLADQAVVRNDRNDSLDTDKFRGADGIVGPYHEKEGSYDAIRQIWSPVQVERREISADFDGRFTIENRYHFTNLNQCSFSWRLKSLRHRVPEELNGKIQAPAAQPGQAANLQIALPRNWNVFDVLYLTAYGPRKEELFTWSFPIAHPASVAEAALNFSGSTKPTLILQDSIFDIAANGIQIRIHKESGLLLEVKNMGGIIPLNNGPVIAEGINNFQHFTHRFEQDNLIIESAFDGKKSFNTLQWTIFPSGVVRMKVNYFPGAYFTNFAGINFSFPQRDIRGVEYMGDGPNRVWKNRMAGNTFGIWKKQYNNTETGESWQYPEFKGYHSKMYWCRFLTTGQPFTVYTSNEDIFLRLFTPAWKTDQWHNYEPLFPTGDISFLHGISSIGTKTQRNETTGPMGMKNIFYDYEKDPGRSLELILFFDFTI